MRILKQTLKKIIIFFLSIKNIILFESLPDLSDNTKAVFDEMLRRGINKKYKLVWSVSDLNNKKSIKNVVYIDPQKNKWKWRLYTIQAKILISCNLFLVPQKKEQIAFYLSHGTPIKSVRKYYTIPSKIQYAFAASEGVKNIYAQEFNFDASRISCLGYPRNDVFTEPKKEIKQFLKADYEKVIVWYPTFRQHKCGTKTGASKSLPILHNAKNAVELNKCAKRNNILIVLKPHFAQDICYIQDLGLSNIRFIDDHFFEINHISSYEFVGSCDALITDYSSIYYDFTLCDKPIAAIWEDIEEYKINPGLIDNYEFLMKGAEKIYTLEELEQFIENISKNIDLLKKERNEIKNLVNYSDDGNNAERVVDFIIEKSKLRKGTNK